MTNRRNTAPAALLNVTYRTATATGAEATATVTARPGGYATTNAQVGPDCVSIISVGPAHNAAADARNAAHMAAIGAARASL
jgi:hypothetical protein